MAKVLGEFFGENAKRRRISDLVGSPVAIVRKVVQSQEKGGEGHLIGVLYARRSMNSCLLMRLLEKSVVQRKQQTAHLAKLFIHCGQGTK